MSNRSATDTILGYFYQFDYSIEMLLSLGSEGDTITIEGIEDIDINTPSEETAIQCKYFSKTKYNHSVIAKPIRFMLSHFKELKENKKPLIKYKLYGHYKSGQDKLVLPITVDFLKEHFLTYSVKKHKHKYHNILGLTDDDLIEFISSLEINIRAKSYESQYNRIIKLLQLEFSCEKLEAEHFYYNNAIKTIKEIAVKTNIIERQISKESFLSKINKRDILFNLWFLRLKGKDAHFRALRKKYFSTLNISPFERFFLIEVPEKFQEYDLKELLFSIAKKWSKVSRRTTEPFVPYIYFHNLALENLIKIKAELQSEGFYFIDGYDFQGASFNSKSIIKKATFYNDIKIKIINELGNIDFTLNDISKTKEIYQFYIKAPFYSNNASNLKHIRIQFAELNDIKEII